MAKVTSRRTIGVVGAGTMGAGIAEVAAAHGNDVLIFDENPLASAACAARVAENLSNSPDVVRTPRAVNTIEGLGPCSLVIEAIFEDLDVKRGLLRRLEDVVDAGCVLATNTSSLSPTAIANALNGPGRFLGLHFFNPVPRMKLVEVIPTVSTDELVVTSMIDLMRTWEKEPIRVAAWSPGFVVNRVARPYYGEAFRLLEEGAAPANVIDAVMTGSGGFRMGPFALADLIGHDVNQAVTRSVWAAFGFDPRYGPSLLQQELVNAGRLGRKSGRGVHDYANGRPPAPQPELFRTVAEVDVVGGGHDDAGGFGIILQRANIPSPRRDGEVNGVRLIGGTHLVRSRGRTADDESSRVGVPVVVVDRSLDDSDATAIAVSASTNCPPEDVDGVVGLLRAAGIDVFRVTDVAGLVVTRTVAMLINQAMDAQRLGVATQGEVDLAMTLGAGYPLGLSVWCERWGAADVVEILDNLDSEYRDGRYRADPLLRRRARIMEQKHP